MLLRDRVIIFAVNIWCYLRHPILLIRYRRRHERWPWPAGPGDYWNKILWRKLFDRNPMFTRFSDKLQYKSWIASHYPDIHTAAVLWTGRVAGDIPIEEFVRQPAVMKSNQGTNRSFFFAYQTLADCQSIMHTAQWWLDYNFGKRTGEWAYYGIRHKLFIEAEIVAPSGSTAVDCNYFCAMGRLIQTRVIVGTKTPHERAAFFDRDGRRLVGRSLGMSGPDAMLPDDFVLPKAYFAAISTAEEISRDMDFVRLDFLIVEEKIYALECTWYPGSGYVRYSDPAIPAAFDDAWDIRQSWFMNSTGHRIAEIYKSALRRGL